MSQTFSQVAALWKEEKRQYVKKATYAVYLQLLNGHIIPCLGEYKSVQEADVQDFVNSMLSRGYATKTVKDTLLVFKMVIRFGSRIGAWPNINCSVHFPTEKEHGRRPAVLSIANQQKLLKYLKDNFSFKNLGILICLSTGLRIGEVCGLQWEDMDTENGVVHVNKTVQRIYIADGEYKEYFLSIGSPKTPSALRDIPMTTELMNIAKPLKKIINNRFYVVSNGPSPLEPRTLRHYFNKLLAKLDIPPIRFHSLRHSFATRCIESKCDYKTVSVILGHASISTTMDLYVHPGFEEKKRCIEKMARSPRR